jgi:uncharacterized delta-60 repeat protein
MKKQNRRLDIDLLEARTVPTAGLDWTFGHGGRSVVQLPESGISGGGVTTATVDAQGQTYILASVYNAVEVIRLTPAGVPDETFGTHGVATIPFDPVVLPPLDSPPSGLVPSTNLQQFYPANLTVDPSGRVVIVGSSYPNVINYTGGFGPQMITLVRLTADGSLDTTFDGDGEAIVATGNASAVTIGPDGKILIAGSTPHAGSQTMPIVASPMDASVLRVNDNGSLDTTFDGDGIATIKFDTGASDTAYSNAAGVGVDGLGRIYATGGYVGAFHIARLNTDGSLDASYAGDGVADVAFPPSDPNTNVYAYAHSLVVSADGTATVGGQVSFSSTTYLSLSTVARVTPNGTADTTFNGTGIWQSTTPNSYLIGLAVDGQGHVVVASTSYLMNVVDPPVASGPGNPVVPPPATSLPYSTPPVDVIRLNADGSADTSFGPDGTFSLTNRMSRYFGVNTVMTDGDGKVLLAGSSYGPQGTAATVLRIDPDAPVRTTARPPVAVSGDDGTVKIYRPDDNGDLQLDTVVTPFAGYTGPVRVATADLTGDGVPDMIYATGAGRADLRLVDGVTGADLLTAGTFSPYESSFTGGLFVAAADLDGDGIAEVVVSPDTGGGARVQILALQNGTLVQKDNFFAIDDPDFRGGARVAVGDLDGDGKPDLAVGAGIGGGPRVALYSGADLLKMHAAPTKLRDDFFAFPDDPDLRGGVFVAVGDTNGDGIAELALGAGDGGGPRVTLSKLSGQVLADFFPDDSTLRGGIHVAIKDADGDGLPELIVGSGAGQDGNVQVFPTTFLPSPGSPDQSFDPFSGPVAGGVFVG